METGEVCDRPLETFGSPLPELTFSADEGIAPAGATKGLCAGPLETFAYSAFIVKVNV